MLRVGFNSLMNICVMFPLMGLMCQRVNKLLLSVFALRLLSSQSESASQARSCLSHLFLTNSLIAECVDSCTAEESSVTAVLMYCGWITDK